VTAEDWRLGIARLENNTQALDEWLHQIAELIKTVAAYRR
jgi:hypothetical protein